MLSFPLFLTIYAGFIHAFETDHLLAVSSIVSQRNNVTLSLKDGIFWGLGHSSTIFLIGILMILFKAGIPEHYFHYFEAIVGIMLIGLAIYRLVKFFRGERNHRHIHTGSGRRHQHEHSLAYGIGLVHGLAGSGALILVVMSQIKGTVDGLIYLVIFGVGCIAGMLVAAGLLSIPFSKKLMQAELLKKILVISSSLLCLLYGTKVIFDNLIA